MDNCDKLVLLNNLEDLLCDIWHPDNAVVNAMLDWCKRERRNLELKLYAEQLVNMETLDNNTITED